MDLLKKTERLNWNEYFTLISHVVSLRSPSKKLKVGSVIVKNNRIISTGYNGFISGVEHVSINHNGHEINTIHAETNAIVDAAKRGVNINESEIYVTHYPCINCLKNIIGSGIKKIYYKKDYNNNNICKILIKQSKIKIIKI